MNPKIEIELVQLLDACAADDRDGKLKILDRMLKLEAIKAKLDDPDEGGAFRRHRQQPGATTQ